MHKKIVIICSLILFGNTIFSQDSNIRIVTTDITNFWNAYDHIVNSNDSLERIKFINELYIDEGSDGLKAMISVRNYADYEFVDAMLKYPKYWNSIRNNTDQLLKDAPKIEEYLAKLKEVYPALKPATVYFPIGVFRSAGTYQNNKILLGAEYYLANQHTIFEELPEPIQQGMKEFMPYNLPLTTLHELIHTQQKPWEHQSIVHLALAEGVAEFISTLIAETPLSPPVKFGKLNSERVLQQFMIEIFRDEDVWNWLWSENNNELVQRDLGYYIGYEICERYYNNATDKKKALKELIELDYSNEEAFSHLVDGTNFLPMTWKEIGIHYESTRPTVTKIVEFENGNKKVSPTQKIITLEFSEAMSDCCRSMDYDELSGNEFLKIKKIIGWSADKTQFSFEIEDLKPKTNYHLIISNFAKEDGGNRLAPYTIAFRTQKR